MKIKDMPDFNRKESHFHMQNMIDGFLTYFQDRSCIKHDPVKISSGIDPSVRFIGSHISVLKPYFLNDSIPAGGYVMSQPCIRTRNLKNYENDDFYPNWGSYFPSLGILTKPERLEDITKQTYSFIQEQWNIDPHDIKIRISARDADLMDLAHSMFKSEMFEIDTMQPKYYRHKLGIDGVWGRNFNLALRDYGKDTFSDIGNVIILENQDKQLGIEIALGSSTVLKQIYGLNHVMDCHPVLGLDKYIQNPNIRVKMEDTIVTSIALYNDGLEPSNKGNTNRLMKKYLEIMKACADKTNLPKEVLRKTLHQYELLEYGSNKGEYTQKIMNFICPTSQNQKSNTEVIENQQKQTGENSSNSIIFTLTQNKLSR